MCGRFDLEPLLLGKLRPERLTSYQIVIQQRTSFAWRHKHLIYFFRPLWAGSSCLVCLGCNTKRTLFFQRFDIFHTSGKRFSHALMCDCLNEFKKQIIFIRPKSSACGDFSYARGAFGLYAICTICRKPRIYKLYC